ncbi:MAG: type II toxin-antitoxin system HicA family toxin [Chloroflexi bacterium]|nr:type II toxin-antitoxin system HicA family toxin [Chloroflexota bacterium]
MPRITPISWKDFENVLIKAGCRFVRQEGDHRIYTKDGLKRPLVLPMCDLPVFIIQNNLRTLGLSRDEYFKLLNEH